ncbi:hypothetical protein DEJ45_17240 [Streptomyces venezuelae]|nr:hypothetical protein DEJ45_17240 [Streptomyces venezuelae]
MSMAYVWPYWWVPWLGVRSAGLFSADQRPVTGRAHLDRRAGRGLDLTAGGDGEVGADDHRGDRGLPAGPVGGLPREDRG